ncbi:MAG: hypothetical protein ACFCGT_24555 [Sandaracinaceae bacterium]
MFGLLLRVLGWTLLVGGVAHAMGIASVFAFDGVPDSRRVTLLVYVGLLQVVGATLFLLSARRAGGAWDRPLAGLAAVLTVAFAAFAVPNMGDLPLFFGGMATLYGVASVGVLVGALVPARQPRPQLSDEGGPPGPSTQGP